MRKSFLAGTILTAALAASLFGQDYLIKPVPAVVAPDANTTFLVDLTSPKTSADFALGSSRLELNPDGFLSAGGFKGTIGFSTAGNFPSNAWTLELILRVPSSAAQAGDLPILSWESNSPPMSINLHLSSGGGPAAKIYVWNSTDYFLAQPFAGGSGRSIQVSAPDKWVYVAFGCDFGAQECSVAARESDGDLLNQDINFASHPWVDTNFLSAFAPAQQAAELARRWQSLGRSFAQTMPQSTVIGSPSVEIKAIRLSNRYRNELFQLVSEQKQSGVNLWTPRVLDPVRTQTRSVVRNVGYPGYNNYVSMPVSEDYIELPKGSAPVSLQLTNLPIGLYTLYVGGTIDPAGRSSLPVVWRPCPMSFTAYDGSSNLLASGKMLLKQSFSPRLMQGFSFHLDKPSTAVTAVLGVPSDAMESAQVLWITLSNQLASSPMVAVKSAQTMDSGPSAQYATLPAGWENKDDAIWYSLPQLNVPLETGPPSVWDAADVGADTWVNAAFKGLQLWEQPSQTFSALDLLDENSGAVFPQSKVLSFAPLPGAYPDDGLGVYYSKAEHASLAGDLYKTTRAKLLGDRYVMYFASIVNSQGSLWGLQNAQKYFDTGNPSYGHDAALALVRFAYDWPALELSLQELRCCTTSMDPEYNRDWSDPSIRNGKLFYAGWSGADTLWLFRAYDQVFPYIAGNQLFANEVHRYVPWVNSPQDVIKLLDNYLVFTSIRDVKRGLIDASVGIEDAAGQLLGPSPITFPLFDLTKQYASIYPASGTYQEMYATALSRSGVYYIGSFLGYALGSAQDLVSKAYRMKQARQAGVSLPMDISDLSKFPKVRGAANFLLDMWVAGGFPFMLGDAGGGPHSGLEATNRLTAAKDVVAEAFELAGDPRLAWVLKNVLGSTSPPLAASAAGVPNPILNSVSHVVPDFGAILELTPDQTNILNKTAATLRLGIGQGHAHSDYLDLNLYAMGLPLAVDLAGRNEGQFWSRPGANWSFLHNHALAHDTDDPRTAGTQSGEPWLRAFSPPLLRASYVDQDSLCQLDRDVILMQVGDGQTYYALDVQRLTGGPFHTWAFHGCESDSLQLNVPMHDQVVRWTDRLLEGTQKLGASTNRLVATWTMTRATNSFAYAFDGGGTLHTVACEPAVLGPLYSPALAPVHIRATLLGRANDVVLQGNPYSDQYSYCFPFLWVQCTNETESVYPAIYEWYRGDTAIVASASILQQTPLQVQVVTTSGQSDFYEFGSEYCLAISRDTNGIRWVKLSGSASINLPGLVLNAGPDYDVGITAMNYATRQLTTSGPLPENPAANVCNNSRHIFLKLRGTGASFAWDDDLLVQQGTITDLHVTGEDTISLTSDQQVLFDGSGNRKSQAMTQTTEDGQWRFRGGKLIQGPQGLPLTTGVFTDANGDGRIDVKTYEAGVGDHIMLPAEVTIKRGPDGWKVQTNVPVSGSVDGAAFQLAASASWQDVVKRVSSPSELRVISINQ